MTTKSTVADARTLTIHRRYARLALNRLGYTLTAPPQVLPEGLPPNDDTQLEEALGWDVPQKLRGRIDRIDPVGFTAPSPWEVRYIEYVARVLDVPVTDNWAVAEADFEQRSWQRDILDRIAKARPWAGPNEIPAGIRLLRTETSRLEARELSFRLRAWLEDNGGLAACDRALILLPYNRQLMDLWLSELKSAGVPALGVRPVLLAETPLANWIVRVAELAGWDENTPISRSTLREALDSDFWSAKNRARKDNPIRKELMREALLGLRRHKVTLTDWLSHLEARQRVAARKDKEADAAGFEELHIYSRQLAGAFAAGANPIARLGSLLFGRGNDESIGWNIEAIARAAGRPEAVTVAQRLGYFFDRLEREEHAAGGTHPNMSGETPQTLAGMLLDYIQSTALIDREEPQSGVQLLPYELYDGRNVDCLMMAGLAESGFPRAPEILTSEKETWLAALGLLPESNTTSNRDEASRWIAAEMERQLTIARTAISRCTGSLTLSFSLQAANDTIVHPGGLLSLLVGGWRDDDWKQPSDALADLRWPDEIPGSPDTARTIDEARLFAMQNEDLRTRLSQFADTRGAHDFRFDETSVQQLERARRIDQNLWAAPGDPPRQAGPNSGALPGAIEPPEAYSSSAVETYAQCPHKYFLSRVLHLSVPSEKPGTPEDNEVGTILHDALAAAAHRAISSTVDAGWSLSYNAETDDLDHLVQEKLEEVRAEVLLAFDAFIADDPTLSKAYLDKLQQRWFQALEKWLRNHLKDRQTVPLEMDEASLLRSPNVRKSAEKFTKIQSEIQHTEEALADLANQITTFDFKTKKDAKAGFREVLCDPILIGKGVIDKIAGAWVDAFKKDDPEAGSRALAALQDCATAQNAGAKLLKAQAELDKKLTQELERRQNAVEANVLFAERPFGMKEHPEPAEVNVDGRVIKLKGQIDRIDWDKKRQAVAVRDYKTGGVVTYPDLRDETAEGIRLQLLLYAIAVEELASAGQIELPQDVSVKQVSLEFLRTGTDRGFDLNGESQSGYLLDGAQASWLDLARAWLASHTEGIESGCFEIAPAKCPKIEFAGAYCDFDWYCPYNSDLTPEYKRQPGPPIEEDVEPTDESPDPTPQPAAVVVPWQHQVTLDPAEIRQIHMRGQEAAQDISRDVLIAAGAGTGKTYNLVLRYLAALADGNTHTNEILCATFTRKAAAQMRHRVRQALFRPDGAEQQKYVDRIKAEPARFRSLVLSLSSAPISTIDALAAHVVREGEEILGENRSGMREGLNESTQADVIRNFVAQKFTDALEEQDPDLAFLTERITIQKLKETLIALVGVALPDWALAATTAEEIRDRVVQEWRELEVSFGKNPDPVVIEGHAETTARALLVARGWRAELVEDLWARGTPRYEDITVRAIEILHNKSLSPDLKRRLPFAHLFVDESQDTSESQVALIKALAELTGAKIFWVGDVKQSIYRFRGAEVDVFERLTKNVDANNMIRGSLRVNRRSTKKLIDSFNSLFSGMLPALENKNKCLDAGSEIEYEPLSHWHEEDSSDSAPSIELISVPGARWPLDPPNPEDPAAEISAEYALVKRIGELVADTETDTADGPKIAVMVNAWYRARHYQNLLQSAGIRAAIQGGGGLLTTPEAVSLLHWLAIAVEKSDAALAAVLRGPGLRMSDAGLYCLAHGDGVNYQKPLKNNLQRAVFHGAFDPKAAAAAWAKMDPHLDPVSTAKLLEQDAAVLERFRKTWEATFRRCGFVRTSELFQDLIHLLDLKSYWFAVPGRGRQAVANLIGFVDLVREHEQSGGTTGTLFRTLLNMDRRDQPRSTGIDAGVHADVIITTHWQAKGLEWPVVVLPDLERTDSGNGTKGILPDRILIPDSEAPFSMKTARWFVGSRETTLNKPLESEPIKPLEVARGALLGPADRSETRRLLYVAMTRAKRKLLLSGTFDAPRVEDATHATPDDQPACSLDVAGNWASTMGICLDLKFDRSGKPSLGSGSLLSSEQIALRTPSEIGAPLDAALSHEESSLLLPDDHRMKLWIPLTAPTRRRVSPSELSGPSSAPVPLGDTAWPTGESSRKSVFGTMDHEGSAFHEVMETWAFGGADGTPFTHQLVHDVLEQMGLGDTNGSSPRVDRIVELFEMSRRADPALIETLTKASRQRNLYPEIPIRYTDGPDRIVDGIVDLVWRDDAGWHVLDYKAGWQHPHKDSNLDHPKLRQHFAQTAMYTRGLQALMPHETIADFGVWYVASGLVVRWDAAEAQEA